MQLTTRTRTLVLLAVVVLLTGCAEAYVPSYAAPDGDEYVSRETYIGSATDWTHVYRVVDKQMGNVCYVTLTVGSEGVGISCLPLEATNAP